MASESVQPLRIQKNGGTPQKPLPAKMARALSELSPQGVRRNSPSFNQVTKQLSFNGDSSPFDASPTTDNSPRTFWKGRESPSPAHFAGAENAPLRASPSPIRRTSLEKLQKASRVKNSNMFARENESIYDPDSSVILERPLASTRVLNNQPSNTMWSGTGSLSANSSPSRHRRTDSSAHIPIYSPGKVYAGKSPVAKAMESPQKSSLSSAGRYAAADSSMTDNGAWSEDDVTINGTRENTPGRGAKTVSFDVGPPQVNEYEMITPDPSSVASGSREGSYDSDLIDMDAGCERNTSEDQEDSFDNSLEDADKTPVVLPEDWRFMSPETANTELADTFEDPFETNNGSAHNSLNKKSSPAMRKMLARSDSVNSEGERRPLPPLPMLSFSTTDGEDIGSPNESIKSDPITSRQHSIPLHPRPASVSKAEILGMQGVSMPLEERLRRLAVQEQSKDVSEHDVTPVIEADLESTVTIEAPKDEEVTEPLKAELAASGSDGARAPPRISRESILRSVKSQNFGDVEEDSPITRPSHDHFDPRYVDLDPDEPLPSREPSSNYDEDKPVDASKPCNNRTKEIIDMYSLPALQVPPSRSVSRVDEFGRESSVIHHAIPIFEDKDARLPSNVEEDLSRQDKPAPNDKAQTEEDNVSHDNASAALPRADVNEDRSISLPDFSAFSAESDFGLGLQSYMSPSPHERSPESPPPATRDMFSDAVTNEEPERPMTPLEPPGPAFAHADPEDFGTPDSVIHHPKVEHSPPAEPESAVVPEPVATIKASGGKLKTRRSNTTAELEAIREATKFTSDEMPPPIPVEFLARKASDEQANSADTALNVASTEAGFDRRQSFRMKLDVPVGGPNESAGLGLDQEFDRLLDAQKRGYLMRQNTKVVVATNRNASDEKADDNSPATDKPLPAPRETRSAGNSPRKASNPTVTTEPWNGRMRRHSTRRSIIVPERGMAGSVAGDETADQSVVGMGEEMSILDDQESGVERGRFFVKVVGVKDLNLPLPRHERTWFQLTLDNGLHCVTTAWLELGKSAPIGQEFELTVFDDLDFSLTLQTKLERPTSQSSNASTSSGFGSPTKNKTSKTSVFSRLLSSPKKRREQEKKQHEEDAFIARQKEQALEAERASAQPSAWDLLHNLVGPDGSFARAIVSLEDHEQAAYGRPHTVDVPCFNNWATDDATNASSTKSKHGGVQRKPPYKIGNLTLQLIYVPKPGGVKDEDMPQSMSACVKQLKEAEAHVDRQFEGHLSQQGGDCPYWRRRFFKLNGSSLTSYHETTKQRRANINLGKATKLIDDRSALTSSSESPVKGKGRRKSAFASDEEGYMFVEEGFRIRFANGEVIDFYAENRQDKEQWMQVLAEAVGKDIGPEKKSWTSAVLAHEKIMAAKAQMEQSKEVPVKKAVPKFQPGFKSVPSSPAKPARPSSTFSEKPPPPITKSAREQQQASPKKKTPAEATPRGQKTGSSGRRQAVRSMMF